MSYLRNQRLALAGAFLLAALPLAAQEAGDGEKGFTFTVDPIAFGVLESDVDTDSSKWQEYRDLSSGFVLPLLNIEGRGAAGADTRWLDFRATNVRRDDARYTFGYGVTGRYSLTVDYNKIPHRFGNDGHFLWTQTAPGRYEIADPVQGALQGALERQLAANRNAITFPFLNGLLAPYLATAQEIDLALQRNRTQVNLLYGGMRGLSWGLEVKHENRNGERPYGASFGFSNVTEMPEPIDYDIDDAELAGEWNTERAGVRFGYRLSTFDNDVSTMIWDNPFRLVSSTDPNAYSSPGSGSINGSAVGFADLWADNEANLLFVNGRAELGGNWYVQGNVSYNIMTQDDPLLPYTLNASIQGIGFDGETFDATDPANLPARNADNKVNVMNVGARAGTRFGDNLELTFNYRLYDYDNRSQRISFPGYVRFHAVWEEIGRITVPYSYQRQDLGAELGWDLARSTRLGFSYNLQSWDRTFREIDSSDEDIFRLTFDTQPSAGFGLRASYELGDRSIGDYRVEAQEESFLHPEGINNIPTLRKFDEAARQYGQYNVQANLFPAEAWNLFFGVTGRDEDYDESGHGLIRDEVLQYNAEIGYAPGENLTVYLFGHRADRDSFQRARQSGAAPSTRPIDDWTADFNEVTDTWGLGLTSKVGAWTTDVSAQYSKSDGEADFTTFEGGLPVTPPRPVLDLPNYEDIELLAILARLDYQITPNAQAGIGYRWEDYTIDSFILQGLQNYLPGAILLSPDLGDYQGSAFLLELKLAL